MKTKLIHTLASIVFVITIAACSDTEDPTADTDSQTEPVTSTTTDAQTKNGTNHESETDYVWDATAVIPITLSENSISTTGTGVTITGTTATITEAATYSITGSLTNGQLVVNTTSKETVRLILNGVTLANNTTSPLLIENAEKVILTLADGTENKITDATTYTFTSAAEDEPNAAIFSKSNLTLYGTGSLTVTGNYNDAIASKDGLIIKSGTYSITAADDGIRGKDYLIVHDASITVNAKGDALKSDNEDDPTHGFITIYKGSFNLTAAGDALQAQTDVLIADGTFNIVSGGGSNYSYTATSAKGIKAAVNVIIDEGTFNINASDDAIHSNGSLVINGGNYIISTGDDGLHADDELGINGGDIHITKSYEGIESAAITINDGTLHIISSDDGINGAGGVDASGIGGGAGGGFSSTGNYYFYMNGGYAYVDASGDGVDINGSIVMTHGVLLVNGPTANNNASLDYDKNFKISGGFVLAAGSSGMAQIPDATSTQNSVLINFSAAQNAGTLVHIQTSEGTTVATFKPTKKYQSIGFSSSLLVKGTTYDVYVGGTATGTMTDGLYNQETYSGGTKKTSFTVSSVATKLSSI